MTDTGATTRAAGAAVAPDRTVAVVGAGTMGQGIAQVALVAGHPVRLYDAAPGRAEQAARAVAGRLDRLVAKGRMAPEERDAAAARLHPAAGLDELADAALVVEAVVERLDVKQELFKALEKVVGDDCLLATNTSSLSVTAIGGALRLPGRFVGMHFFNPAPLLPLVEVVSGFATDTACATRAYETARAWGKTPVACADTPGFIVNRLARPFYAEAFAVYEERAADPATIDAVLRESGGFRMGAFELTDLIGQDVNEAVTTSVWEAFFQDPRFRPSLAQRRLVEAGMLGRKTGRGWYAYDDQGVQRPEPHTAEPADPPAYVVVEGDLAPFGELLDMIRASGVPLRQQEEDGGTRLELPSGGQLAPADGQTSVEFSDVVYFDLALDYREATRIALAAGPDTSPETLAQATGLFQALGKKVSVIGDVPGMIVARTVARLVDLAREAVAKGVASEEDVDTAMRLGVNYPLGPIEWGRRLGRGWAYEVLEEMHRRDPSGRYAPSLALYRHSYAEDGAGAPDAAGGAPDTADPAGTAGERREDGR
ncbi:3-hydroxyacyl-CoA dehydrogenase [Streptomyces fradiae]|uniref:3-hydroxyacyl-CoA dehydrogenase n=1 Tax=Streptomyces fradiae ATCC 10745 = DSM 40063 TaxID=1319510 RepID=A0A1Y2P291_STRFR|nr:3-hydroxyacyl-CoA dehydrogenase [Streptomyces fradiae]KAF0651797.1 3-hydroxyacyl-CoA dehydrogenase [Streptomyces fradiae ATCC 10745 = DSM 40063]OSY53690.1 3-hydroxyadipyl-CoA dehydrogenase [Streptomyces fradiae ATCC 10745 = DSM 40063]QEV13021.1 3-hydroxyacyl-CoA dehydrogenase [Streptomyces fradiae ATCC 10745 = DSM 40063]